MLRSRTTITVSERAGVRGMFLSTGFPKDVLSSIAQLAEHALSKRKVASSNLAGGLLFTPVGFCFLFL